MLKPHSLHAKDTVRVVASSSPFDKKLFLKGVEKLKNLDLKVKYGKGIFQKRPYLAGSDARRFQELKDALEDKDASAILFAKGGYGSVRLLPLLQKNKIKPKLKIVAGFSDITNLLMAIQQRWKWVVFYAPIIAGDFFRDQKTLQNFQKTLFTNKPLGKLNSPQVKTIRRGKAEGILVGGCLTMVADSIGTFYELDTKNKILFLEDTSEKPYRIDRMLWHLKLAGFFDRCRGVVLGDISGPNPKKHYLEWIKEFFKEFSFPVIADFPVGHCDRKFTLPLGVRVELNATQRSLTFLESALK